MWSKLLADPDHAGWKCIGSGARVHTTLPTVDKAEAPTTQALVAQPESKAPDDTPSDEDPNLLNSAM
jgi:hypothetical protein